MQVQIVFLGTSAGTPTRERNVASLAVRLPEGGTWLVDCGEGTQHRLADSGVHAGDVERVLLTHLHGDHCWGLPGLLATLGLHGRERPLEVVGPEGLRVWLETTFHTADVRVPYPLSLRELPAGGGSLGGVPWSVTAVPLVHRVTSFAWVLRESPRRGRFDVERSDALGVPAGPARAELAAGRAVTLSDGRRVAPGEVLGPERPGRVIVVCGDSADSRALLDVARGCDVLVHECTFDAGHAARARRLGHSTSEDVARLARALGPRRLVLTHLSPRYEEADAEALRREVVERCPEQEVVLAHDRLVLPVPPREAVGETADRRPRP
jgi:ribonuclease Z